MKIQLVIKVLNLWYLTQQLYTTASTTQVLFGFSVSLVLIVIVLPPSGQPVLVAVSSDQTPARDTRVTVQQIPRRHTQSKAFGHVMPTQ